MRRRKLIAGAAGVFRQLQRTGASRGINVIEVQHTATGPARLGDFHGYIVILPTGQAGPQTFDLQRQGERQQQAGIEAVQIVAVTGQHRVHDIEPYLRFRMGIERPHDARHIDALAPCLQRHRAGDRDLRQMWAVASRDLHRQAEVRDANMRSEPRISVAGPFCKSGKVAR